MLPDDVLRIADAFWARDFDRDPGQLRPPVTEVQAHTGALAGAGGIWILVVGPAPLISLPPALLPVLGERARAWTCATVEDPTRLAAELAPARASTIIGPAFIGYAPKEALVREAGRAARALTPGDAAAVTQLRAHVTAEAWEHGGSDLGAVPTFGAFAGDELAALAGYELWHGTIAHLSIVTAPAHRGRGHGTAAVAAAATHALAAGLLPQYRTLKANQPSMRVAGKLGFLEYGWSTYVRLAETGSYFFGPLPADDPG